MSKLVTAINSINIRLKLMIILIGVGLVTTLFIGVSDYNSIKKSNEEAAFAQLTSLRATKARQIESYFTQIRNQVTTFSEDQMIVSAMRSFKDAFHQIGKHAERYPADYSAVHAYYQKEFLPRLAENTGSNVTGETYWPADSVTHYLQDRYLANNPSNTGEKDNLSDAADGSAYSAIHAKYHDIIRSYLQKFSYYDIFLVDIETGHIVYTVFKEVDYGTSLTTGPYKDTNLAEAFRAARDATDKDFVKLVDFAPYDPSYGAPASFIASPIYDGDTKIGVLLFQMPVDVINNTMTSDRNWKNEGFGTSGETYLIGDDNTLRSDSRFLIEDAAGYLSALKKGGVSEKKLNEIEHLETSVLLQPVNTKASKAALNGETGISIVNDYRNIPVLSAYSPLNIEDVHWGLLAEKDVAEVEAPTRAMLQHQLFIGIGLLVGLIILAFLTSISFVRPIYKLQLVTDRVAEEDYSVKVEIQRDDELGKLGKSFNAMIDKMREAKVSVEEQMQRAQLATTQAEEASATAESNSQYLSESVDEMSAAINRLSEGDLTARLSTDRTGAIGTLFATYNVAISNFDGMIAQVKAITEPTRDAAVTISDSAEELSASSQEQSQQANEVAASVEEMTYTIAQNASNVSQTTEAAQRSEEAAKEGGRVVGETVDRIKRIAEVVTESAGTISKLGKSSAEVGEIITTIDEIADQTNLLALNAAIEAARAGEQGRGFAVVADEVRKLAERTSQATRQIAAMIKNIQTETGAAVTAMNSGQEEVKTGLQLADQAGRSLREIVSEAQSLLPLMHQITTASDEQSTASEVISQNISVISEGTSQAGQTIGGISQAAGELRNYAEDLYNRVSEFKTS